MEDRHKKLKRNLYFLIPFAIIWVGIGTLIIVTSIDTLIFFTVAFGIFVFGAIYLFRTIRSIQLDLREQPVEAEGSLSDKRRVRHQNGSFFYLYIDTIGFDLQCGRKEWDMVGKGDRVHVIYHRNSKFIENLDVLEKANVLGSN
jgi:hypothetical protein